MKCIECKKNQIIRSLYYCLECQEEMENAITGVLNSIIPPKDSEVKK